MKELSNIENLRRIQKESKEFNEMLEMLKEIGLKKKEYELARPYEHQVIQLR